MSDCLFVTRTFRQHRAIRGIGNHTKPDPQIAL
jgi:hypothetical protein